MRKFFLILFISSMFVLSACNTQIDLNISKQEKTVTTRDKNPVQADVKVKVLLKKYLVTYMNDLLGTTDIHDIIDVIGLEQFLELKSSVSQITVRGVDKQQKGSEIQVSFVTDNILYTLRELDIPFIIDSYSFQGSDTSELQLQISREFITVFLNSFEAIRDLNVVDVFFPDKETVKVDEFPEYVAWSFSDYESTEAIIDDIRSSTISFSLIKGVNIQSDMPDNGWQMSQSRNMQEKGFELLSTLYSDEEQLRIVF